MTPPIPSVRSLLRAASACLGLLLPILPLPAVHAAPEVSAPPRREINLNREWRFIREDVAGADAPSYDDSKWSVVGLPHSFSLPYFLSPQYYQGYGWYRRHLNVPPDWEGKRMFLDFAGVFQVAEVHVNGKPAGSHAGGYTGFQINITDALHPGDNVIAVRVNNIRTQTLAPIGGEHVFSGGIYRDVKLVVADPVHVAWYGTWVTTPDCSATSARVAVQTEIENQSGAGRNLILHSEVLDPDGRRVASVTTPVRLAPGTTGTVSQKTEPLAAPKLWHPDHPWLYTLVTRLEDGKRVLDETRTPFGFRWFEWTADRGFFLNGSHLYFRGANVHQDHAGWGDAITDAACGRDVRIVKEAGFDFIRGSHYPHHPAFADACDRQGLLFWSENCFWGGQAYPAAAGDQPAFEESVRSSLREMIRINRNHPSIVAWSMGNEVFFSPAQTMPEVRKFLKELVELTHTLDPVRPAAIGGVQRGEIDHIGDVAGYNGDGARLFIDPKVPNAVTEYGSVISDRPGEYKPGWGDLAQCPHPNPAPPYFWRYPWRSGEVIWCAFDHGSNGGHFGCMGIVDYFRIPKRAWYWYRNEYRHIPPPAWPKPGTPAALRLAADKTTLAADDGTDDAHVTVTVVDAAGNPLSDSPPVTLSVASGPGEFPTGPSIEFDANTDIPIRDGQAAIEFRSYYAGKTVLRATSPGLEPATLAIETKGGHPFVPGRTVPAAPRPYVRFEAPLSAAPGDQAFGTLNPTGASSEAAAHKAPLANDGDPSTYWSADPADPRPWWQVDLEHVAGMRQVKLTFPGRGDYRCRFAVSEDGQTWRPVEYPPGKKPSGKDDAVRLETLPEGTTGRFIRVSFDRIPPGKSAALAEVQVYGREAAAKPASP